MKPEELLVLVTLLIGAAMWSASSATAQIPANIMPANLLPDVTLDLRSAWEAVADRFCDGTGSKAGAGFDAAMLK
ncbi:MAG TPA: hypothetical protein VGD08_16310 [Stellaceae bacterium]|jgi:hypothetical protein